MSSGASARKAVEVVQSHSATEDRQAKYSAVSAVLSAMTREGDALIFSCNESNATYESASGRFAELSVRPFGEAYFSLSRTLALKPGSVIIVEVDKDARGQLGLDSLPIGSVAMTCLESNESGIVCAAIYQNRDYGNFDPKQIQGLKATSKMLNVMSGKSETPAAVRDAQVVDLQAELRDLRSFYRHFADSIRQCFWVSDVVSGRTMTVSENFETVWGASRQILTENIGGFLASVSPEDKDRVMSEFHTKLTSVVNEQSAGQEFESEHDLEFRVVNQDGEVRWMWLRMSPFGNEGTKLVFIADDVTERKELENRGREREADLITRARALAVVDLASGVAHEINNPLTIIIGRAFEMRRQITDGTHTTEGLTAFVDKIQSTAIRISDIIKSLKSLARSDRSANYAPINVALVARDVRDVSLERFKHHDVTLEIEDPPEELKAEMNMTLVSQLVLNLVNNAFDAVSELPEKWVKVDFTEDDDSIYISVTDSGAGIPIKIRSRIFDPFFTTKDPGKGTGLGLALSLSVAAHHHGSLRIDTLHAHTRFVFQLPKRQPRTSGAGTPSSTLKAS